jgi:hypothetical protein
MANLRTLCLSSNSLVKDDGKVPARPLRFSRPPVPSSLCPLGPPAEPAPNPAGPKLQSLHMTLGFVKEKEEAMK